MKKALYILLGLLSVAVFAWAAWITDVPPVAPIIVLHHAAPVVAPTDPRLAPLNAFFEQHGCVDSLYAKLYLEKADEYSLDWRLLPALSWKEESCTRNIAKNNLWGWQSGAMAFTDIPAGIDFVANHVGWLYPYVHEDGSNRTTLEKLRIYNNHPGYAESVLKIMDSISTLKED